MKVTQYECCVCGHVDWNKNRNGKQVTNIASFHVIFERGSNRNCLAFYPEQQHTVNYGNESDVSYRVVCHQCQKEIDKKFNPYSDISYEDFVNDCLDGK